MDNILELKTINERYSGLVFIKKVKNGTMEESNKAMIERLDKIPRQYLKTLTTDRGSENLGHKEIENILGLDCFYAHAYHSWERGCNENLNGLIRRFLPKKTDFRTVSDYEIKVTVSIGISTKLCPLDEMIKNADNLLYEAKNTGRNKVVIDYL